MKKQTIQDKFEEILKEPEFFSINGLLKSDVMLAMQLAYNIGLKNGRDIKCKTTPTK